VPLEAPDGEPLRLDFESFVSALRGDGPVPVSGDDGREALEVALRIVAEIERTMPALRGAARPRDGDPGGARRGAARGALRRR
jgi:predicted dehydrogenase